jgi:cell division protein FtsI/penicillin-binding protein 2
MPLIVSPRRRAIALVALLGLAAAMLSACTSGTKTPPEQRVAEQFLAALNGKNVAGAAALTTNAAAASTTLTASLKGLGDDARPGLAFASLSDRTTTSATAIYNASWQLAGAATPWTYQGALPMTKNGKTWLVSWSPSVLFDSLPDGQHLVTERVQPERADLLDGGGVPLFTKTPVVIVGIEPANVTNLNTLAATLAQVLGVSAADIISSAKAAQPHDFVTVITLRQPAYEAVRAQIHDLPGTVFRTDTQLLGPTAQWAQPLLGQVGAATKEIIDGSGGRIVAGDQTGLSGLQLAYDKQLSGTPGLNVYAAKDTDDSPTGKLATVAAPKPGTDVRLSLNRTAQSAAQNALANVSLPAAIVALQPSTGRILAVANSANAPGNIALTGQYPAGSTFKIITYSALFTARPVLTPQTTTGCPGTVTVDGRTFTNENSFDEGTIPISSAFAYSCNTSAINFNDSLPDTALATAAAKLGLGAKWNLPVDAFAGSIPATASGTEKAAEAIGQGQVLVSPLLMASIAGAAATGRLAGPSLAATAAPQIGSPYPTDVTSKMNTLMRAVVDEPFGTGHQLADLPGDVEGKTGTAEFGNDVPPRSHSWMVGVRGDLAFAVFVYGGERSTTTAVPLTEAFLAAVPA